MTVNMKAIIGPDRDKKLIELICILEDDGISIEEGVVDSGIIEIPPNGAVLRLIAKDFDKKNPKILIQRLSQFIQTYHRGVVIIEGYHRFGDVKKKFEQEIQIHMILNKDRTWTFRGMIPTRNVSDSAIFVKRIINREQIEDIPPEISRKVGKIKYLFEAQIAFMEGLALCGKKKAIKLLEEFGTPETILNIILSDPDQIRNIKGFGENFIKENQKLLRQILN